MKTRATLQKHQPKGFRFSFLDSTWQQRGSLKMGAALTGKKKEEFIDTVKALQTVQITISETGREGE